MIHVEQSGLDLLERFFARLRGLDFVALLGEEPFERDDDSALVVNYQQSAFQLRSLEVLWWFAPGCHWRSIGVSRRLTIVFCELLCRGPVRRPLLL